MTLTTTIKQGVLLTAMSTTLIACDALQIGPPLDMAAAQSINLLSQGGFDNGFGNWRACSDPTLVTIDTNTNNTDSSAQLSAGGCLYQTVPAKANDYMIATCSARKATNNWASMTLGFLDEDYQPLKTVETTIPDTNFTTISGNLRAPADAAYAELLIYTEDGAVLNDCELINTRQGMPQEYLLNAWFEDDLNGWQTCSHGSVNVNNDIATINGSCVKQKFTAIEGLKVSVTCDGIKADDKHAAVALGFLDSSTQPIEMLEAPLTTEEGNYPTVTLTGPATTSYVEVMVYTDGEANINSCSLSKIEDEDETEM